MTHTNFFPFGLGMVIFVAWTSVATAQTACPQGDPWSEGKKARDAGKLTLASACFEKAYNGGMKTTSVVEAWISALAGSGSCPDAADKQRTYAPNNERMKQKVKKCWEGKETRWSTKTTRLVDQGKCSEAQEQINTAPHYVTQTTRDRATATWVERCEESKEEAWLKEFTGLMNQGKCNEAQEQINTAPHYVTQTTRDQATAIRVERCGMSKEEAWLQEFYGLVNAAQCAEAKAKWDNAPGFLTITTLGKALAELKEKCPETPLPTPAPPTFSSFVVGFPNLPLEISTKTQTIRFAVIPKGTFQMGSDPNSADEAKHRDSDEGPVHTVTITRNFWLATTEITQAVWEDVFGLNPSHFKKCGGDCPVETVTWFDALEFCNRLSKLDGKEECYDLSGAECRGTPGGGYTCKKEPVFKGLDCKGYRLPTEAEWEYAARAGTTTALYTGPLDSKDGSLSENLDKIAWYWSNSAGTTHPVRKKDPNPWGLYDMLGNTWEWTWDWYDASYDGTEPKTDPLGARNGERRVCRGGSWYSDARWCRAAYRNWCWPDVRFDYFGFRPARSIP